MEHTHTRLDHTIGLATLWVHRCGWCQFDTDTPEEMHTTHCRTASSTPEAHRSSKRIVRIHFDTLSFELPPLTTAKKQNCVPLIRQRSNDTMWRREVGKRWKSGPASGMRGPQKKVKTQSALWRQNHRGGGLNTASRILANTPRAPAGSSSVSFPFNLHFITRQQSAARCWILPRSGFFYSMNSSHLYCLRTLRRPSKRER